MFDANDKCAKNIESNTIKLKGKSASPLGQHDGAFLSLFIDEGEPFIVLSANEAPVGVAVRVDAAELEIIQGRIAEMRAELKKGK